MRGVGPLLTDGAPTPRRCAVLGSPIRHSLSPTLHRAAYAELGLDWTYDALDVTEADLGDFLDGLDHSWRGLSLTMPLKRAVLPLLDEVTEPAAGAGVVNTVILDDGRRIGHNTDIPGATAAIRERVPGLVPSATVLGGGATAASVLIALADLGCRSATLLVRDAGRATDTLAAVRRSPGAPEITVRGLGTEPEKPTHLLVSTIPAAAQDAAVTGLVRTAAAVFEVLYDPWPTPLAKAALRAGLPLVSGLDLLVHQAALQVGLMTGVPDVPLDAMRTAGDAALAERARAGRQVP